LRIELDWSQVVIRRGRLFVLSPSRIIRAKLFSSSQSSASASVPMEMDAIYRLRQCKIIRLNHEQKTQTEITLAEVCQAMDKRISERAPQPKHGP